MIAIFAPARASAMQRAPAVDVSRRIEAAIRERHPQIHRVAVPEVIAELCGELGLPCRTNGTFRARGA